MRYCFLIIIACIACRSTPSETDADSLKDEHSAPIKEIRILEPDSVPNTFRIQFPPNATEVTFTGVMDSTQEQQTYIFHAKEKQNLDAEITPETPLANIRFNQIFMPDGVADGPFGLRIQYALTATGDYRLIVAESLMAEPWTGKYSVRLEIK